MNPELEDLLERWPMGRSFNLPEKSTIIVVGAYKGITMELLDDLYHPARIVGFEPQLWAQTEAVLRLVNRDNCTVLPFGLGDKTTRLPMGEFYTDACSFINVGPGSREQGEGQIAEALDIFNAMNLWVVDLMVMNIEGYEFQLLPYLRKMKILNRINRIAIQWHPGLNDDLPSTDDMNAEIDRLLVQDEYDMILDERPAWTYMETRI